MKAVKTMESSMPLKRRRLLCGLLCLTLLFTLPSRAGVPPFGQAVFAESLSAPFLPP